MDRPEREGPKSMQPTLWPPEPPIPLDWGPGHYVPVVQFRSGELAALNTASPSTWAGLTPLVNIVGPKGSEEELTASRVKGWVKRIAAAVADHPFYLDTMRLKPQRFVKFPTIKQGMPALKLIYAQARKRQLVFIPVVRVGHTNVVTCEIVRDAVWQNGSGVALRYSILDTLPTPPKTRATLLKETLDAVEVEPSSADLILDLGYLSPDDDIRGNDINLLINQVTQVRWRNIVLLATGMPSMLGCVAEGTLGAINRPEWDLWRSLNEGRIGRSPIYGDYAIQHPTPPQDSAPGMRANIRYTTREKTLIVRGKGAFYERGKAQYRDLCQQLIAHSEYRGTEYSWGDRVIQECAEGLCDPGSQTLWRGAGTSHHLRVVTEQLSEFGASS